MTHCTPAQAREEADLLCSMGLATPGFMLRSLADQLEQANLQHEALKQQVQTWKMEAQTQAATVHEIYRLCAGGTGEPPNIVPVPRKVIERALHCLNTPHQADLRLVLRDLHSALATPTTPKD